MNIWRYVCDHAKGMAKGEAFYRQTVDAGKVIAPIATPIVQTTLAAKGMPVTAEAALSLLASKAASPGRLPIPIAAELQTFVGAHLP